MFPDPVSITTAADALASANVAKAAITASDARMDAIEQGQLSITNQLTSLTTQLNALLLCLVVVGGGDVVGGGGVPGSGIAGEAVAPHQRRRLDPSDMDKLPRDISYII